MKLEPINKSSTNKKKYQFQVLDLEAWDWINFIVGGFYDGENYFEFRTLDEFSDFINFSEKSLNIYAHFGGGYDFMFLIQNFLENQIKIEQIIPRGSNLLSMKVKGHFKTHTFRDSSAILPFGLKKLTENFNVETKKGEYDHSQNRGYSQELADYLKSDCLGLYQVLEKYFDWDLIKNSGPSSTIATQAQKIFRTYLKEPLFGLADSTNEFCKQACIGGRTEIFRPIGKKVTEVDVNSLYPYVMKENLYPAGRAIKTGKYHNGKFGIYEVEVTAPEMFLPIIGVKRDKKLLFPTGVFNTTTTSIEIDYAKSKGYKFKIIEGFYFSDKKDYFSDFITDLYKIRKDATKNSINDTLAKLIMNSSYGKFNINIHKENLVFDNLSGGKHFRDIILGDKTIEIYTNPVELKTFVHSAIAAFILANARIHMHKLMEKYQDDLYYTDTDSLFLTNGHKVKTGDKLGQLKFVKTYDEACFLLPKTYIAENKDFKKIAMKGFNSRKIKHFTVADFKIALAGDLSVLNTEHDKTIAKFKTALLKNKLLMHKKAYTKRLKSKYNKREIVLQDGVLTTKALKI